MPIVRNVLGVLVGLAVLATAGFWFFQSGSEPGQPNSAEASIEHKPSASSKVRVETVSPTAGGVDIVTVQPGTVHSFDWADLFAKVSGYLKVQSHDIGDRVAAGEVIAVIDAPELKEEVTRCEAEVKQADAKVAQMKAHIDTAEAERKAAVASIAEGEAEIKRAEASQSFHKKQFERVTDLFKRQAVDEKLVDEAEDEYLASKASLEAAKAHVVTQQAQVAAAEAKIVQAKADLTEAEAQVAVAKAALGRAKVFEEYTRIRSPYDGVVTQRNFHVGHFIRMGDETSHGPMYTISRTDKMRVIVEVPDREVPYANPGDQAKVKVDALPDKTFEGTISRIAFAEDADSRSERIEIDLPNPKGILKHGMYGTVTIVLEEGAKNSMRIPSSCLIGDSKDGKGTVFVVENGHAVKKPIELGKDNGIVVEVIDGLNTSDRVIANNNGAVQDGTAVDVVTTGNAAVASNETE